MKKIVLLALLLVFTVVFLCSCKTESKINGSETNSVAAGEAPGNEDLTEDTTEDTTEEAEETTAAETEATTVTEEITITTTANPNTTKEQTTTTTTSYTPRPLEPSVLSVETETMIKSDYQKYVYERMKDSTGAPSSPESIIVNIGRGHSGIPPSYFGCYNGGIAVFVISENDVLSYGVVVEDIAGYRFAFADSQPLRIYKNGEFTKLKDAYEKGLIDSQDVRDIKYYLETLNGALIGDDHALPEG